MTGCVVAATDGRAGTEGRLQTEAKCKVRRVRDPPTDQGWAWETDRPQWGRRMQKTEK